MHRIRDCPHSIYESITYATNGVNMSQWKNVSRETMKGEKENEGKANYTYFRAYDL